MSMRLNARVQFDRSKSTRKSRGYVDLTEVTSLDASGRACLAALPREGVQFIGVDCLTKAIVVEINQG